MTDIDGSEQGPTGRQVGKESFVCQHSGVSLCGDLFVAARQIPQVEYHTGKRAACARKRFPVGMGTAVDLDSFSMAMLCEPLPGCSHGLLLDVECPDLSCCAAAFCQQQRIVPVSTGGVHSPVTRGDQGADPGVYDMRGTGKHEPCNCTNAW